VIRKLFLPVLVEGTALVAAPSGWAGQAPAAASDPDIPLSHRERVTPRAFASRSPFYARWQGRSTRASALGPACKARRAS